MRRAVALAVAFLAGAVARVEEAAHARTQKASAKASSHSKAKKKKKKHRPRHKASQTHTSMMDARGQDPPPDHVDPLAKTRFSMPTDATASPAYHYGSMTSAACLAELDARKIPYEKASARGVATPVRLTGPLHGVTFHGDMSERDPADSPHEIADCSLVLALDDFSELLAQHEVVEVLHYSMWRPPPDAWPADQIAKRHQGAVAIDAAHFIKKDGTKLTVLDDFHGKIDDPTCGDGAGPHPDTPAADELRAIVCEAAAKHIFNVILTPDYNYEHRNHFHMEVTSGVKWFLLH
jgi:hypothetical protein